MGQGQVDDVHVMVTESSTGGVWVCRLYITFYGRKVSKFGCRTDSDLLFTKDSFKIPLLAS
eukprot:c19981_g2_i1 orf=288-470(+)